LRWHVVPARQNGGRVQALDDGEVDDDLVRDMVEVVTFSVRASSGVARRGTGR
jgi:predicted site-specific integrase-resolvase